MTATRKQTTSDASCAAAPNQDRDEPCLRGPWTGIGSRSVGYAVTWSGTGTKPRIRLNGMLLACVSLLGGTRLSTLAYGVVALVVYGIAFIGG